MCSFGDVTLGGAGRDLNGKCSPFPVHQPLTMSCSLAHLIYDHKPITAEFRARNQGLRAPECSGAIAWV